LPDRRVAVVLLFTAKPGASKKEAREGIERPFAALIERQHGLNAGRDVSAFSPSRRRDRSCGTIFMIR
jgi:hypothetical protein